MDKLSLDKLSAAAKRWGVVEAIFVYLLWVVFLGPRSVGLEYDEALLHHGAVHILNSRAEPTFAHDWGSWLQFGGRYWPLTVIPYMGAVKSYIALVPFAIFGTDLVVIRGLAAALGAFGIFGIAKLVQAQISANVATAVALVLASHPAYVIYTFYDNSAFGLWMASLGLICLTLRSYLARRDTLTAICLGFAAGIAVWGRLNFIWLIAAALLAYPLALRARPRVPKLHVLGMILGSFAGSFPMLVYQYRSRGGALRFLNEQGHIDVGSVFTTRLDTMAKTLLTNEENAAIWGGVPAPRVLAYTLAAIVLIALVSCLLANGDEEPAIVRWSRGCAFTFIIFALFMMASTLPVSGHHLVALVPIGALAVTLMMRRVALRWRHGKLVVAAAAIFYFGSATISNVIAIKGVRATGGVGSWSDQIGTLADHVEVQYGGRELKILDWGLQNNLYVLSNASIRSKELFWAATRERTGFDRTWHEEAAAGGVFIIRSSGNRVFPQSAEGLLAALDATRQAHRVVFRERTGKPWAEIIEIPAP